ncbi:hypothetical protein [Sphingobacterium sp. LRF_L2]|uniref:hypothetical protein n=1 Tax=Sphingobacterium sp. LRF_L2 TaxID=3369421 RepID=UPI003F5EA9C3
MTSANKEFLNIKNFLLLIVLLFALAPCAVKEALHTPFDIEYTQPLNKTKTTVSNSTNCSSTADFISASKSRKIKIFPDFHPCFVAFDFQKNNFGLVEKKVVSIGNQPNYVNRLPPKYILFKRLKIAVV